jgi:hypothetical protein
VQPLWNPAQPQSEHRQLIPAGSVLLLDPPAVWELSQGLRHFLFLVAQAERDDWNNWNFGTLGTCGRLKHFERSEAPEPLEQASFAWEHRFQLEKAAAKLLTRTYSVFFFLKQCLALVGPGR